MRFLAALALLFSVLTTHAVALERASAKALGPAADAVAVFVVPGETAEPESAALVPTTAAVSETATGPCLSSSDCAFLLPTHRFEAHALIPVHGKERENHAQPHHESGVERPPIS